MQPGRPPTTAALYRAACDALPPPPPRAPTPRVPEGWFRARTQEGDRDYYVQIATGQTQWDNPAIDAALESARVAAAEIAAAVAETTRREQAAAAADVQALTLRAVKAEARLGTAQAEITTLNTDLEAVQSALDDTWHRSLSYAAHGADFVAAISLDSSSLCTAVVPVLSTFFNGELIMLRCTALLFSAYR